MFWEGTCYGEQPMSCQFQQFHPWSVFQKSDHHQLWIFFFRLGKNPHPFVSLWPVALGTSWYIYPCPYRESFCLIGHMDHEAFGWREYQITQDQFPSQAVQHRQHHQSGQAWFSFWAREECGCGASPFSAIQCYKWSIWKVPIFVRSWMSYLCLKWNTL